MVYSYYKVETESPVKIGNYTLYLSHKKSYFEQTNKPNEEDFKNYMIQAIDKVSEQFMSFDKALKDYFDTEKKNWRY